MLHRRVSRRQFLAAAFPTPRRHFQPPSTILTVVETCHRQSRHSFDYLTAAMQAHFAGQPVPSLLSGV